MLMKGVMPTPRAHMHTAGYLQGQKQGAGQDSQSEPTSLIHCEDRLHAKYCKQKK